VEKLYFYRNKIDNLYYYKKGKYFNRTPIIHLIEFDGSEVLIFGSDLDNFEKVNIKIICKVEKESN
jgi:hypothetical protein